jgi:hypothetical protein
MRFSPRIRFSVGLLAGLLAPAVAGPPTLAGLAGLKERPHKLVVLSVGITDYSKAAIKNSAVDAQRVARAIAEVAFSSSKGALHSIELRIKTSLNPSAKDLLKDLEEMTHDDADARVVYLAGAAAIYKDQIYFLAREGQLQASADKKSPYCNAVQISDMVEGLGRTGGDVVILVDGLGPKLEAPIEEACVLKPIHTEPSAEGDRMTHPAGQVLVGLSSGIAGEAQDQDPSTDRPGGPFAFALEKQIGATCDFEVVFERARADVLEATSMGNSGRQLPEIVVRPSSPIYLFERRGCAREESR